MRGPKVIMRIEILQPGYLTWLSFLSRYIGVIYLSFYDDVQYDKEGWRNRNRIKTANGIQWLTVPVIVKFEDHPLIYKVKIDNNANWRKKIPFFNKTELFKDALL